MSARGNVTATVCAVASAAITVGLGSLYIARVDAENQSTVTSTSAPEYAAPSSLVTVDGQDYPVCRVEDCSDQPGQVGVWFDHDSGRAWLSLGEHSYPVTP